ncbi:MAG: NACHT domain-containing protein, partial [Thermoanaerobaculia bacterium]
MAKPRITSSQHLLPFERLSPADFERLCLWLVRREDYERAEHLGAAGGEQGRDVVAWRNGRRVVFQCKRVQRLDSRGAEKEIKKLQALPVENQPDDIIFVVSTAVSVQTRDRARAAWGDEGSCHFWAGTELDERVKRHQKILEEFFDQGAAELAPPHPAEALLKIWLDRVARAHRELMPYFQERSAPLLEHVYVELQLDPERMREAAGSDLEVHREAQLLSRRMSIRDVLDLDPIRNRWITRRWLLRGDPGSGKTTLLRYLAWTLADAGGKPWVPVFESLPRLMADRLSIFRRIEEDLERADQAGAEIRRFLEEEAGEGCLLFLLDGLDEVPREARDRAEVLLSELAARWPKSPIVATTRPIGAWSPGPEFLELEVLPFDAERRRAFLERWFDHEGAPDRERAASVAGTLEADRGLRELASNPLYLSLLALLIQGGEEPARNRTKLYDQIFDLLEEGRHHKPPAPIRGREVAHEALRHLANQLTEVNRDAETAAALERRLVEEEKLRQPLLALWGDLREYLKDVAEKTGILGPHDGPETDWRFWHRTFREALTAEGLAAVYEKGGERALCNKAKGLEGDLGRWAEPYALAVGRVSKPDRLVLALVEANRELGLRAVATAQGLHEETLRHVLKLSENWVERRDVYERLPELIDDPLRVLALVDQLRQTRNGNDLFFLEQAAVAVGWKWSDAKRAVTELQQRFYDHIPQPPEELFQWIDTPHDGRVELWREIPAGKFRMGSPETEEGGFARERPQHKVRIGSPFRMA